MTPRLAEGATQRSRDAGAAAPGDSRFASLPRDVRSTRLSAVSLPLFLKQNGLIDTERDLVVAGRKGCVCGGVGGWGGWSGTFRKEGRSVLKKLSWRCRVSMALRNRVEGLPIRRFGVR